MALIGTVYIGYPYSCSSPDSPVLIPWWRHQMEAFSALLAFCAGNSPVTGEFPSQRSVTWSFGVFFDLCLNKRLSKQLQGWWFETPSHSLWRHCNVIFTRLQPCATVTTSRNAMMDAIIVIIGLVRCLTMTEVLFCRRRDIETLSALSAHWHSEGNLGLPLDFPHKGPVTVIINYQMNKQSRYRWLETSWSSRNVTVRARSTGATNNSRVGVMEILGFQCNCESSLSLIYQQLVMPWVSRAENLVPLCLGQKVFLTVACRYTGINSLWPSDAIWRQRLVASLHQAIT